MFLMCFLNLNLHATELEGILYFKPSLSQVERLEVGALVSIRGICRVRIANFVQACVCFHIVYYLICIKSFLPSASSFPHPFVAHLTFTTFISSQLLLECICFC